MSINTFFANFGYLANAPNGLKKMRELILRLAVQGKLVPQDPSDEPASKLLKRVRTEKLRLMKNKKIKIVDILTSNRLEDAMAPKGWCVELLGNIAQPITKGATPTTYGFLFQSEGIRFVKVENVKLGRIVHESITSFISEEANKSQFRSQLQAGDILFSIAGTIGETCVVRETDLPANTNQALAIIRGTQIAFLHNFLKIQLDSFVANAIKDRARGGAMNNVSLGDLKELMVFLPPLAEQHRIVAKVDQLMALCDELELRQQKKKQKLVNLNNAALDRLITAREPDGFTNAWRLIRDNVDFLYTTPETITKLRQAILQIAVQGKLVPQNPNDEPASVLLAKIKAEKERLVKEKKIKKIEPLPPISPDVTPYELPKGWQWVRFGAVTICRDGERIPVSQEEREKRRGPYDYYGASGVIDNINDYLFDKSLLLIGEDGANLINRSTPIAFMAHGKYWVNNHAHVIDGISEEFLRYIELFINAIDLKPFITGTAQPKMNQTKMNSIVVAIPPKSEQHRIVTKVDQLMKLCDELDAKLIKSQTKSEKLVEAAVKAIDAN